RRRCEAGGPREALERREFDRLAIRIPARERYLIVDGAVATAPGEGGWRRGDHIRIVGRRAEGRRRSRRWRRVMWIEQVLVERARCVERYVAPCLGESIEVVDACHTRRIVDDQNRLARVAKQIEPRGDVRALIHGLRAVAVRPRVFGTDAGDRRD